MSVVRARVPIRESGSQTGSNAARGVKKPYRGDEKSMAWGNGDDALGALLKKKEWRGPVMGGGSTFR